MDNKARFKQLMQSDKEIPQELYSQYDESEPRNMLASTVNPMLDKYVNPSVEKLTEFANKYSPVELSGNFRIPEVSKGERKEYERDFAQNMATGMSGGISKIGSPILDTLKKEVASAGSTASKREMLESFLNKQELPNDVYDSAERMKRLIVQRQNTENAMQPMSKNTDGNLENLIRSKLLEAKDVVNARRQNQSILDRVAPDVEQAALNKILNPDDATAFIKPKK